MQDAIEQNRRDLDRLGLTGEEITAALNSLRGKSLIRMVAELTAKVTRLEETIRVIKEDSDDATYR
jgi:hypothetical protein